MNFALYRDILSIKPIRRLITVGMIARIPHSAAGVMLTLHIVLALGQGYAAAGAAAAVMTIGIAVGAPWRGRRVDTVGLRRALIPSVVSEAVIWSIVPHVSYQVLLPLVFVGGLLTLPIFSVVRQSLGVLATGDQRRTAFTLDSISTELVFMVGPAVGAVVATSGLTVVGLTVVGVSTSLAGIFLMWFNPPTRSVRPAGMKDVGLSEREELAAAELAVVSSPAHPQEAAAEFGPVGRRARLRSRVVGNFSWFTSAVAVVFTVAAGTGMVLSGSDVGIVAALELGGHQGEIGIVFLFWCAASVVGGLLYGAMHRPLPPFSSSWEWRDSPFPWGLRRTRGRWHSWRYFQACSARQSSPRPRKKWLTWWQRIDGVKRWAGMGPPSRAGWLSERPWLASSSTGSALAGGSIQ